MITTKKLLWLIAFSISFGFLECAVVIYLRLIYYPSGFTFPMVNFDLNILRTEILREISTLAILTTISNLSAITFYRKLAYFLLCFGIWDISYYCFLKIMINWPESLLSWDILFLIPIPWIGPVLAPCIISLTMILLSFVIMYFSQKKTLNKINLSEWIYLILGSILLILSFTAGSLKEIMQNFISSRSNMHLPYALTNNNIKDITENFSWVIFAIGEAMVLTGLILLINRLKKIRRPYRP